MTEKKKRHPKRSDEEWIQLIQECRTSGMTDHEWCELNHIQTSKFYYHIRRLRAKACSLPPNPRVANHEKHEIVKVGSLDISAFVSDETPADPIHTFTQNPSVNTVPAIRLRYGGCCVEILNSAEPKTITSTLAALHLLC